MIPTLDAVHRPVVNVVTGEASGIGEACQVTRCEHECVPMAVRLTSTHPDCAHSRSCGQVMNRLVACAPSIQYVGANSTARARAALNTGSAQA